MNHNVYTIGDFVVCQHFVLFDESLSFSNDMAFEVLSISNYDLSEKVFLEISLGLFNKEVGIGFGIIRLATDSEVKKSKLKSIFR
jgi:hypothetical protein